MDCINKARCILESTDCTCVFCKDDTVLTDRRRGVRPLLDLLEQEMNVVGFSAADKVVGKAAAYLYCLLGVSELYAGVISQPALSVLEAHGIVISYSKLVPSIQNRTQNGPCPMEHAVWEISDPKEALTAIYAALEQLKQSPP